jgi:hypothetical protein
LGTSFLRAETRSVLSRNRIDLSDLRIGIHGSVIRLHGHLTRAAGLPPFTGEGLEGLERELRRLPGVRRVELHLSNWRRKGTEWRSAEVRVFELKTGPQAQH